jgi:hypothetical protein
MRLPENRRAYYNITRCLGIKSGKWALVSPVYILYCKVDYSYFIIIIIIIIIIIFLALQPIVVVFSTAR